MLLTPQERDRLLVCLAAGVARARLERGLRLNIPEATAVICASVIESARAGARLSEAVQTARTVLCQDDVLPGVAAAVGTVKVEAVFDDGTRLAVVTDPFGATADDGLAPGQVLTADGPAPAIDSALPRTRISVQNTSEVPVSVTSHWHFFEANPRLRFDRAAAYGRRLAVPAGDSVRFDPGSTVEVELVDFGGRRVMVGFSGLVDGPLDEPGTRAEALRRVTAFGYLDAGSPEAGEKTDETR